MLCPYCEEQELQLFGIYYCCHKCKVALDENELAGVLRANEDRKLMERLAGQKITRANGGKQ